jgi:hypothetical protein
VIRLHRERRLLLPISLLVAATLPVFASCAEAEDSRPPQNDASVSLPEASSSDVAEPTPEAGSDAGCDASDNDCVASVISCDVAPWCPVPSAVSTRFTLKAVWGTGPTDVWAVGSGGSIVHWDGTAWIATPTDSSNTFNAVLGTSPTDIWAVSMTDVIYRSSGFTGGTAQWTLVPGASAGPNEAMMATALWHNGSGDLRIGARSRFINGTFFNQYALATDDDGGIAWKPIEGRGTIYGIWGAATDLWMLIDNSDYNTWERAKILHGVAGPKGALEWTSVDSQSTLRLEAIWGSSPDDIWAVGDKGTIRRMKKGASRWEVIPSPTQEQLHAVWGSAADDVWAVGDNGTILHFDGTEWTPSLAAFGLGKKPDLRGVWGSSKNDVWIVGESGALHFTGPKPASGGGK